MAAPPAPPGPSNRVEYRWLLPASLQPDEPDGAVRRSGRDWAVDLTCFLVAAAFGVLMSATLQDDGVPPAAMLVDQVVSALGCTALWFRRRWPVGLATVLVPFATFSLLVQGAVAIALFTVAVHRPFRTAAVIGAATLLTAPVYALLRPDPELSLGTSTAVSVAGYSAVLGWGMLVRSRRQLFVHLQERAERAEVETRMHAEHTRRAERERIARDIHDVLAHRLSLLSVCAGALEYRSDAPSDEQRRAAGIIREQSHLALQDVREVLGVLRAPVGDELWSDPDAAGGTAADPGAADGTPPPAFSGLAALVDESREAGAEISFDSALPVSAGPVPESAGRAAYRIVQEGLTNARKHAPGRAVHVAVSGAPGRGLEVVVRNTTASGTRAPDVPGSGRGLAGLRERAALAGGRLRAGPAGPGVFELRATLPWEPAGGGTP